MSGEIVDMIHESGTTDLAIAYSTSLNRVGFINRTLMQNKSSDLASEYAAMQASVEKSLAELIAKVK